MNQDELAHFGVKGMRWGVRKSRPAVSSAGGTILSVTQRASNSVRGVAVAKVPGKLEFYRARVKKNGFINEDGTFEDDYKISHVSPKLVMQRAAYTAAILGTLSSPVWMQMLGNKS